MILCNFEKHVGIAKLESLRDCMLGFFDDKLIEDIIPMFSIFSQNNLK